MKVLIAAFSVFFVLLMIITGCGGPETLVDTDSGRTAGSAGSGSNRTPITPGDLRHPVFISGRDGYHTYRIPALYVTPDGTVLAFCEGRKSRRSDTGDIDLLLKRSTDNGKTWSAQQTVWDDGDNTCGNPCPVYDHETGILWLLMTWNLGQDKERQIIKKTSKDTRRIYVSYSADSGLDWSEPTEITSDVKKTDWTWYATGPGIGIQLNSKAFNGRLVIPCDHIEADTEKYYSHIIYSDDHGKTWKLGGRTPTDMLNECQAAELSTGQLMLNMRNYDRSKRNRAVSYSLDGGESWSTVQHDSVLIEPICQASLIRYEIPFKKNGFSGRMQDQTDIMTHNTGQPVKPLIFSNPASREKRINMTVRMSRDDGITWPVSLSLHEGPSAYSCLGVLNDGRIACLYEAGEQHAYETIIFETLTLVE